jgi:hypothetical protein
VVTRSEHHQGIPLGNKQDGKMLIHINKALQWWSDVRWMLMRVLAREVSDDA